MFEASTTFLAGFLRLPHRAEFGCMMAMIVLGIAGIWAAMWASL